MPRVRPAAVIAAVTLAALLAFALLLPGSRTDEPVPTPRAEARPLPAEPRPRLVRLRRPIPEPREEELSSGGDEEPPPDDAAQTVDYAALPADYKSLSAVTDSLVLTTVATMCIWPWMEAVGIDEPLEVEWEAVTDAAGLVEVRFTYDEEVDPEVLACFEDVLWDAPWTPLPVEGERVAPHLLQIDTPPEGKAPPSREAELARLHETVEAMRVAMAPPDP